MGVGLGRVAHPITYANTNWLLDRSTIDTETEMENRNGNGLAQVSSVDNIHTLI